MTDHILPHNHGEHLNTKLLIDNIAKTEDFQIVADLFKVLGDNSRVRIFWLLCHCEECVITFVLIQVLFRNWDSSFVFPRFRRSIF